MGKILRMAPMELLFSQAQLVEASGKTTRTVRYHIKQGWLKPEPKFPGVRRLRFKERTVRIWLNRFYPEKVADFVRECAEIHRNMRA